MLAVVIVVNDGLDKGNHDVAQLDFQEFERDLSVISWARHIMSDKNHGYANEEETHGGVSG
ncbi:hypothetical protein, partial [Paraburkholderia rhizosphaerae]